MQDEQKSVASRNSLLFIGALLLLLVGGAFNFGPRVFAVAAVSIAVGVAIELLFQKARNIEIGMDIIITPLLVALLVPSIAPLWMVGIGSGFAVFFGRLIFGGQNKTVFNAALVGVMFLMISFPQHMTTNWLDPLTGNETTMIPVLQLHLGQDFSHSLMEMLRGYVPGMIGETFMIGIVVLGLGLAFLKVIDWRVPAAYLGFFFVLTAVGFLLLPQTFVNPFWSLITGGVLFAAFFLATDPHGTPKNTQAIIYYGLGLAVITIIIRTFGAFQDGYVFAIIIMNAVAPLLDSMVSKETEENSEEVSA